MHICYERAAFGQLGFMDFSKNCASSHTPQCFAISTDFQPKAVKASFHIIPTFKHSSFAGFFSCAAHVIGARTLPVAVEEEGGFLTTSLVTGATSSTHIVHIEGVAAGFFSGACKVLRGIFENVVLAIVLGAARCFPGALEIPKAEGSDFLPRWIGSALATLVGCAIPLLVQIIEITCARSTHLARS